MSNNQAGVRNRQNLSLFLFFLLILSIAVVISFYVLRDDFSEQISQASTTALPLDKSSPQELWMARVESEKNISDQKMDYLTNLVLENQKRESEKEQENQFLREELAKFKDELRRQSETMVAQAAASRHEPVFEASSPFVYSPLDEPPLEYRPTRVPLTELVLSDAPERLQHVDRVIPAGTSVRAILVSSVDMPCNVFNATDPQPIKLRLIDDGHLPKKVRARLKSGIIIASAFGDLSNERIYIRLERLTQVRADGKFIETEVAGYVTGEDGKYGLKGIVVDKSYKMVENAAISGVFSGLNDYLQARAYRGGCNIYETGCGINASEFASTGIAGGANSAFDMLTNYYIKRAEQIRPVISAAAGRIVDVTFIHSAELGDLHTLDRVKRVRDCNRRER